MDITSSLEILINTFDNFNEIVLISNNKGQIIKRNQYINKEFPNDITSISDLLSQMNDKTKVKINNFVHNEFKQLMIIYSIYDNNQNSYFEIEAIKSNINKVLYIIYLINNVTDRFMVKENSKRIERTYYTLNRCARAILKSKSIKKLSANICEILSKSENYNLVWIGQKMTGPEKLVIPIAKAGQHKNYIEHILVKWDDSKYGRGPTGKAIRKKEYQLTRNIEIDPSFRIWRKEAIQRNLYSSIAIPILIEDNIFGTLNVYADQINAFNEREVLLLNDLCDNLSYAFSSIKRNNKLLQTERLLRYSEERYRLLIDRAPMGIIMIKLGIIHYVNPKILEYYGYQDSSELVGLNVDMIQGENFRDELTKLGFAREKNLPVVSEYNTKGLKKNGSEFDIQVKANRVVFANGSYTIAFINDISEKIDMEKKIKEQENQIFHTHKMDAISRLGGNIAHDFNNILTGVIGYADLIREEHDVSLLKNYSAEIKNLSLTASSLTKKLLTLSKKGITELRIKDINKIILDNYNFHKLMVTDNIQFILDLNSDILPANIDQIKFEQVLLNTIMNAKDAIKGKGKITIKTEAVELMKNKLSLFDLIPIGNYVKITVSDNGIGISENIIRKVFEPYFSTKNSTGLGMSIIFGIIKQFSGFIDIKSKVGVGTSVIIYLPEKEHIDKILYSSKSIQKSIFNDLSVLIVDDNLSILKVIKKMMQSYSSIVKTFEDPVRLLEEVENSTLLCDSFDLFITDIVMPSLNGIDLIHKMREYYPSLPVVIISGFTDNYSSKDLKHINNSTFLQKPFDINQLINAIKLVLPD